MAKSEALTTVSTRVTHELNERIDTAASVLSEKLGMTVNRGDLFAICIKKNLHKLEEQYGVVT